MIAATTGAPEHRRGWATWIVLVGLCGFGVRACDDDAGCICDPRSSMDVRSDETSGPVRARIVIERGWRETTGHLPGAHHERVPVMQIEGTPVVRLRLLRCGSDEPEITADPEGQRIAYRCGGGRWSVVYRRADYAFEHCSIDAGSAEEISWARVPAWDAVAPDVFLCAQASMPFYPRDGARGERRGPRAVLAAERAAGGEPALERLLVRTRDHVLRPWPCGCDAWIDAVRGLSAAALARVRDAIGSASSDPRAPAARVWRALVLRGVEGSDASLRAIVERLVREIAPVPSAGPSGSLATTASHAYAQAAVSVLVRHLARRGDSTAGALACTALTAIGSGYSPADGYGASESREHLVLAIGATRASCPATTGDLACGLELDCDASGVGPPRGTANAVACRPEQLLGELTSAIAADPLRAVWVDHDAPPTVSEREAITVRRRQAYAAAVVGGTLSPVTALKMARRRYRVEPREGEAAECSTLPASAEGRACYSPDVDLLDVACRLTAQQTTTAGGSFDTLVFDDTAQVARTRRAMCMRHGRCDRDDQCCPGTSCASIADGGTRFCIPPPSTTAADGG